MDGSHPLVVRLQGCRALSIILSNTAHIVPRISAEPCSFYLIIFYIYFIIILFYFICYFFVSYITMGDRHANVFTVRED